MRILLAEDEKDLSRAITTILEHSGYDVDPVYDGQEAVEYASSHSYDCMILDIMMPLLDGLSALTQIRESGDMTPVIFLTAKSEVNDRIEGLDKGADDYLTKPFAMGELIARVKSLTRRNTSYTPTLLQMGTVTFDTKEQELKSENSIRLSSKESKMMEFMLLNKDKKLTDEEIYHHVWGEEETMDLVYVYVSYLNNKLKSINANIEIIEEESSYTLRKKEDS